MNKSIKRTMGLALALFVAVSMCIDITGVFADETKTNAQNTKAEAQEVNEDSKPDAKEQNNVEKTKDSEGVLEVSEETEAKDNAVAVDNATSGQFYFEIEPDLFIKDPYDNNGVSDIFESQESTVGFDRNLTKPNMRNTKYSKVKDVWSKIRFKVYSEDGKEIQYREDIIGNESRSHSNRYLGPFDKGKKYTVRIDYESLPPSYHAWLKNPEIKRRLEATTDSAIVTENYKAASNKETYTNNFVQIAFKMDMVGIVYAKNEEVAKDIFNLDDMGKPTGWNPKYKNGIDYFLKSIDPECNFTTPSKDEMEKLAKAGYRPEGFYSYVIDENGEQQKKSVQYENLQQEYNMNDAGYSWLMLYYNNDNMINTKNKTRFSSIYTLVLDQSIPKVTFDVCGGTPEITKPMEVGYKMSIKTDGLDSSVMPKNPMKAGYVFAGWNTKQDGTGEVFTDDTVVTDDITVYAQWTKEEKTEPTEPSDADKPGKAQNNEDKPTVKAGDNSAKSAPKTGDSSDTMHYVGLATLMSISVLLVLKKKRSYK